ncbi:basic leucine zipper transcriptional factor ATF-like [Vanacampus margaritifer]
MLHGPFAATVVSNSCCGCHGYRNHITSSSFESESARKEEEECEKERKEAAIPVSGATNSLSLDDKSRSGRRFFFLPLVLAAMAQGSDGSHAGCRSPSPAGRQSSSDDVRKVMRREKNRIAAQKSRMRQMQKADSLHLESESLEKENAALRKEVKQLTEEAKYLSSVLSTHEAQCTGLTLTSPGLPYPSPHHHHHHAAYHQHIAVPHYQH